MNVRTLSGTPANFAAYLTMIQPGGKLMGMALPNGGHMTHGYFVGEKKLSFSSYYFQSKPYYVHPETRFIDYDTL